MEIIIGAELRDGGASCGDDCVDCTDCTHCGSDCDDCGHYCGSDYNCPARCYSD